MFSTVHICLKAILQFTNYLKRGMSKAAPKAAQSGTDCQVSSHGKQSASFCYHRNHFDRNQTENRTILRGKSLKSSSVVFFCSLKLVNQKVLSF